MTKTPQVQALPGMTPMGFSDIAESVFLTAINDGAQYPDNVKAAREARDHSQTPASAYSLWASRAFVAIQKYRVEMKRQGETVYLTREDARRIAGKLADYYLNHVAEMDEHDANSH